MAVRYFLDLLRTTPSHSSAGTGISDKSCAKYLDPKSVDRLSLRGTKAGGVFEKLNKIFLFYFINLIKCY